ncbi:MAG: aminotransferase class I/II-fold pyridoxal phosphate-dependent enzyme [Bacillota bacterium]
MARLERLAAEVVEEVQPVYRDIERTALENHRRVLDAFHAAGVREYHFLGSTGYGYGDAGREALEKAWALIFGAEEALVRVQLVSGTHALATCFFGLLAPGDELLCVQGTPYDTLCPVIGLQNPSPRSLTGMGVYYRQLEPLSDGGIDLAALRAALSERTRVVFLQRSCGYRMRRALRIEEIEAVAGLVHRASPRAVVLVDNCYGEFVETREPCAAGADLVCGSLIKNPGGGLAPTGGYIAGRREYVQAAAERLTAPGLGAAVGPTLGLTRLLLQGLYLAPHFVSEALKGAVFAARFFERLGFTVMPAYDAPRGDIVQAVRLGSPERVMAFCRAIQQSSPVDAAVRPEPGPLPGYADGIVMAAGTFIQGASLELTADAPLREPYAVYLQGGLSKEYVYLGVLTAARELIKLENRLAKLEN